MDLSTHDLVWIDYTNHKGERRERLILPQKLYWGSSQWHPEPQWLLAALDVEKKARRDFAMQEIHQWTPATAAIDVDR